MKRVYPTFIIEDGQAFLVYVPDMGIYTEGKSMAEAIKMARDAIGLKGIDLEDDQKNFLTLLHMRRPLKKLRKIPKISISARVSSLWSMWILLFIGDVWTTEWFVAM